MLHEAHHHCLIHTNQQRILKNPQNGRYLFFCSDGWRTDETYEVEVRAVVEQQYLPKVPVLIQHTAIFYHSVAEPDRDVLKLPIQGCVQANSASRQQWRKWIVAAELEWAKAHGGIL